MEYVDKSFNDWIINALCNNFKKLQQMPRGAFRNSFLRDISNLFIVFTCFNSFVDRRHIRTHLYVFLLAYIFGKLLFLEK